MSLFPHHCWSCPCVMSPLSPVAPRLAGVVTAREAEVTAATGTMVTLSARLRRAGERLRVLQGTGMGRGTWGWGHREGDVETGGTEVRRGGGHGNGKGDMGTGRKTWGWGHRDGLR